MAWAFCHRQKKIVKFKSVYLEIVHLTEIFHFQMQDFCQTQDFLKKYKSFNGKVYNIVYLTGNDV